MWNKFSLKALANLQLPAFRRQPAGTAINHEHVDEKVFALTIGAAVVLHMLGMYLWHLMPDTEVMDIPVHALSIKLGDGEPLSAEEQKMADQNSNKSDVENAISKAVQDPNIQAQKPAVPPIEKAIDKAIEKEKEIAVKAFDKALAATGTDALVQESAQKLAAIAKQFVRNNNVQAPSSKGTGNVLGNSTAKEAELMSRYEQLISAWIEKFKLYPDEARAQGMEGETVVRIRIDRKGNMRYYILERSTGYPLLDKAAIDMVKRANPVPAVPNDYPQGDLIEFLIPVNFHLQ